LYDRSVSSRTEKPPTDRRARRKAQTRERLVVAARAMFARQGIDATRINEITEEADVGFGSFYNYFESKGAIVDAVLEHVLSAAGAAIDAATADIEDPAEVVAVAHRSLVERAATDQEWGWLLVRLDVTHDIAYAALGPYAARDLARGIDGGRFDVEDREVALIAGGGALLGVMRAVLEGRLTTTAAIPHAAGVLRMLGMTPADAAEVASRPLPAA
jgi:AcrR family transcriptional regulator